MDIGILAYYHSGKQESYPWISVNKLKMGDEIAWSLNGSQKEHGMTAVIEEVLKHRNFYKLTYRAEGRKFSDHGSYQGNTKFLFLGRK